MIFTKGQVPWNRGKTGIYSQETLKKMSDKKIGKPSPRKGVILSQEIKDKISKSHKGSIPVNKGKTGLYHHTEESKRKLSEAYKRNKLAGFRGSAFGKKVSKETRNRRSVSMKKSAPRGANHYNWNPDRELVKYNERHDSGYNSWARQVKYRDDYKCKISNLDCGGALEAHHILAWSKFPELRYNVNNGISLCFNHHPRKREDEVTMAPIFQKLLIPTIQ